MKSKVQWKSLSDKSTSSFCPIQQFLSNIVVISGWGWLDICFLWNSLISPNHWIAPSRPVIVGRMLIFSKVYYRENFQSIYFRQSLNPPQVRDYEVLSDLKKMDSIIAIVLAPLSLSEPWQGEPLFLIYCFCLYFRKSSITKHEHKKCGCNRSIWKWLQTFSPLSMGQGVNRKQSLHPLFFSSIRAL